MRILITNTLLVGHTGTELYVRDLALGLKARGHQVGVFTPRPGPLAEALQAEGLEVVADPAQLREAPELIHGHHRVETLVALARFPHTPAIFLLHDAVAWHDAPPLHPRILTYAAVDEACRDRLLEAGIPKARTTLLPNAVDLRRFQPREPLPPRPTRALVFSNYAKPGGHLDLIREACAEVGLPLDEVGDGVGHFAAEPEKVLGGYDVVFGKARCALEAMATGCAVVLCDTVGFGGLVTRDRVEELRALNYGRRSLSEPHTVEGLVRALRAYDSSDAAAVSAWVREEGDLERLLDRAEALYVRVRAESFSTDLRAELAPYAEALQSIPEFLRQEGLEGGRRQGEASAAAQFEAQRARRSRWLRRDLLKIGGLALLWLGSLAARGAWRTALIGAALLGSALWLLWQRQQQVDQG